MNDMLNKTTVLVLNRNWQAIHTKTPAEAYLVEVLGRFDPKLVKMCPAGDRAED